MVARMCRMLWRGEAYNVCRHGAGTLWSNEAFNDFMWCITRWSGSNVKHRLCIVEKYVEKLVFYVSSTLSDAEHIILIYIGNISGCLHNQKNLPSLIAARLQRFVYMVSMYPCKKMLEAEYLSKLPIKGKTGVYKEEKANSFRISS